MNRAEQRVRRVIRPQAGLSLIELLLSIGVVSVLLASATFVVSRVQDDRKALSAAGDIAAILSAVHQIFPNGRYAGLTTAAVIQSGLAPESLVGGASLVGPWGAPIGIAPASIAGGVGNVFNLRINNVPTRACNEIVHSLAPTVPFVRVRGVGAWVSVKNSFSDPEVTLTRTAATSACSNSRNSILLTSE